MIPEKYRPPTTHAMINGFAIRCFRDTGDADYIAARLAIRSRLPGPFLWSAEQAIEKYLKCILMLNRIPTLKLGHDINKALDLINSSLPFKILLSEEENEVFQHIASCNGDRYLIFSFYFEDVELLKLDKLVWRLRQYCTALDKVHYADTPNEDVLLAGVRRIETGLTGQRSDGHLKHAFLEKILADINHPAHEALTWKNFHFSLEEKAEIMFNCGFQEVNSPLFLNPELAPEVAKLMYIPSHMLAAAERLSEERRKN